MNIKVAAKAIFRHKGKVLIMADPNGKWDFPGGGIEPQERLEEGLRREVSEELSWDIDFAVGKPVHVDEWFIEKLGLHVVAVFYLIDLAELPGHHTLSEEHSKIAWVAPGEMHSYDVTGDTTRALEALGR